MSPVDGAGVAGQGLGSPCRRSTGRRWLRDGSAPAGRARRWRVTQIPSRVRRSEATTPVNTVSLPSPPSSVSTAGSPGTAEGAARGRKPGGQLPDAGRRLEAHVERNQLLRPLLLADGQRVGRAQERGHRINPEGCARRRRSWRPQAPSPDTLPSASVTGFTGLPTLPRSARLASDAQLLHRTDRGIDRPHDRARLAAMSESTPPSAPGSKPRSPRPKSPRPAEGADLGRRAASGGLSARTIA